MNQWIEMHTHCGAELFVSSLVRSIGSSDMERCNGEEDIGTCVVYLW